MMDWIPTLGRSGKPRYQEIAEAIEAAVRSGVLAGGVRLPPQRRMAERLGIDFTTVSRAYAEAQARGLIDSHVGRGTFVRRQPPPTEAADPRRARETDLSMNLPPEPTDPELLARMAEGLQAVAANLVALLRYQSATGGEQDKAAASSWLSMRGMVPRLERVAITPGAHATMTAILTTIAGAGDSILCVVGLPSDAAGVLPDALEAAIRERRPKALYLNPTLHNPTTLTIPPERRMEIAAALSRHGLPLIEDDAYGFIPAQAPAPFATLAPELTWHIGRLAKCIGAGLRLAYAVAPDARAALALAQAQRAISVMPSPLSMALATRWIEDGTADGIRRFVRAETAARQAIVAEALAGLDFRADPSAFNIWLKLPPGAGRAGVMGRMAGRRIGLMPSDAFTVEGAPQEMLRVCIGGAIGREELRAGLMFLGGSLAADGWVG